MPKIVLNLGAGKLPLGVQTAYFKEWKEVRVDIEELQPDIADDIRTLEKVPDQFADAIWACHVIEHIFWQDLPMTFHNMLRVLKNDGFAVIRVPNLAAIADKIKDGLLDTLYMTSGGPIAPIDIIYGQRGQLVKDAHNYNFAMMHKTGFTPQSMSYILNNLNINGMVAEQEYEVMAILYKDRKPTLDELKF